MVLLRDRNFNIDGPSQFAKGTPLKYAIIMFLAVLSYWRKIDFTCTEAQLIENGSSKKTDSDFLSLIKT
jgi:hypothetical protein